MTLINLTPHPVTLLTTDGDLVTLPTEGQIRLGEKHLDCGVIDVGGGTTRLVQISYSKTELPDPVPGRILLVSALVAQQHPDRADLVYPADVVRDASGTITHARALARVG